MSGLRIYGIARTRAFRALWMAKELGLEYEHLPIEIGDAGARYAGVSRDQSDGVYPSSWTMASCCSSRSRSHFTCRSTPIATYILARKSEAKRGNGTLGLSLRSTAASISGPCAGRLPPAVRDASSVTRPCSSGSAVRARRGGGKQEYLLGNDFTGRPNVAAVLPRSTGLSAVSILKAWLTRCLERPAAREAMSLKSKADNETPAAKTAALRQNRPALAQNRYVRPRSSPLYLMSALSQKPLYVNQPA